MHYVIKSASEKQLFSLLFSDYCDKCGNCFVAIDIKSDILFHQSLY